MARDVLLFTDSDGFGGAEVALLTLMRGLDRTRWRPTLVHHPGAGVAPLVEGARGLGLETWAVPAMPHGALGLRRLPRFVRALRSRAPDVFHATLTWPLAAKNALLGAIAAGVPGVVVTVQLHMEVPVTRAMRAQQRLIAARASRILPVSVDNAHGLHALLGWPLERMEVVRNAVDAERFDVPADPALRAALGAEPGRPLVLVPARLDAQKGHRHLLHALAHVPEPVVVLAGDGPERPALERLAAELGVAGRVRFLGTRSDVPSLLAAADLFVLPSLYEGLPVAVLEAMAAGVPVLATAIGSTAEAVHDGRTGLLVPPGDAGALAAGLRRLLGDRELAARLGGAGRERARTEFSAAAMVARVADVYELFGTRRAAP
jgi:glycosyltransferase involved in cell wall biosynthesis